MPTFDTLSFPRKQSIWLIPFSLLAGISSALYFHWPLYTGLAIALGGAVLHARISHMASLRIVRAAVRGMRGMAQVCMVLLLIGVVIACWMDAGVIPFLTSYGASYISVHNVLWVSFLLAAVLSLIIGSSIATWSVLGPPLMALAGGSAASILAGAIVSGGMVGDRSSPVSSGVLLMAKVTGLPSSKVLPRLLQSLVGPMIATLCLYAVANHYLTDGFHVSFAHASTPQGAVSGLVMPALVLLLTICRVPLLYNLLVGAVIGIADCTFVLRQAPLHVAGAVWHGVASNFGGRVDTVGGVLPMVSAVLLILFAGAFQAVVTEEGSVNARIRQWLDRIHNPILFTITTYLVCILFAFMMGSQMLTILISGNTLQPQFEHRGLSREALLQVISDSAELVPSLVPWNLLGLQSAILLGVPTYAMLPYGWYIYLTLAWSVLRFAIKVRKQIRFDGPQHERAVNVQ